MINYRENSREIASRILEQFGGIFALMRLHNAKYITHDTEGSVTFKFFGSNKSNFVKIELNSIGLYDMTFYHTDKWQMTKIDKVEDIYITNLQQAFQETTFLTVS
jgi:hypothetical protein